MSLYKTKAFPFYLLLNFLAIFLTTSNAQTYSDTLKSPRDYNLTYGDSMLSCYEKHYREISKIATIKKNAKTIALSNIFLADINRYQWEIDSINYYMKLAYETIVSHQLNNPQINFEYQREKTIESYFHNDFDNFLLNINLSIELLKQYNNDPKDLGYLYYQKKTAFFNLDKLDSALVYIDKSQNTYPDHIKKLELSYYHMSRCDILNEMGYYEDALIETNKAFSFLDLSVISVENLRILIRMGDLYMNCEDCNKALEYYFLALQNHKSLIKSDNLTKLYIYSSIAYCFSITKNYHQAIQYLKMGLRFKDEVSTSQNIHNFGQLARAYRHLDSLEKTDFYYRKAINLSKKQNNPTDFYDAYRLKEYGNFRITYLKDNSGRQLIDSAYIIFNNLLKKKSTDTYLIYTVLNDISFQNKDYKLALSYCEKGIKSNTQIYDSENFSKTPSVNHVLSLKHHAILLNNKIKNLYEIIRKEKNSTKNEEYIEELKKTICTSHKTLTTFRQRIKSSDSKYSNTTTQKSYYQNLIESSLLIFDKTNDSTYYQNAYKYAIANKAATLQDIIAESNAKIDANLPDSLLMIEKDLSKKINALSNLINNEEQKDKVDVKKIQHLEKNIFDLNFLKDTLIRNIETKYPDYYNLKYDRSLVKITDIQKNLSDKQTHIEYFMSKNQLFTYVLTHKKFKIVSQKIDTLFFNHLANLINIHKKTSLTKFDITHFKSFILSSRFLYKKLIEPVSDLITNNEIIINPDDQLWYLPFETLLNTDPFKEYLYKELPYLIKTNPISYSYSSSLLLKSNKQTSKTKRNLLVMVPSYDKNIDFNKVILEENNTNRSDLQPLPASIEEAEYIHKIMGGELLKEDKATEMNFKKLADKYSILHLAMHAVIDNNKPQYSKLVFTQGIDTHEDNFLNTYEIYNKALNAQMVVLSSCNSGNGKMQKGEGIISIARAFLYAGCPSLVMTLWSVDDRASAKLMQYYYDFLKLGQNKSRALQQAKIKFLKTASPIHQHPYYWASYNLIGSNDPITLTKSYKSYYVISGIILLLLLFSKKLWRLLKLIKN